MNLIFIPGLLCTEKVWCDLNLLRDIYTCIDADVSSVNSIESMADNIVSCINPDEEYFVIGISMGGYIALELAVRGYDWLKKLVLLNTTANPVDKNTISDREEAIYYAENDDMESILDLSRGYCFFNKKEEYLELERSMAYEVGCKAYINQQQAIINRKTYLSELAKINHETLIISSKHDQVINYHDSLTLFKKIKKSEIILLNNVGHLPTVEKSKLASSMVRLFLEQ